jgi:hypothetical protein
MARQILGELMKYVLISFAVLMSACSALPSMFTAAEEIADDTAIKMEVSKEAIPNDAVINMTVQIQNKPAK